jgi:hypothetical protein
VAITDRRVARSSTALEGVALGSTTMCCVSTGARPPAFKEVLTVERKLLAMVGLALVGLTSCAGDHKVTLVIEHPSPGPGTYIDAGDEGPSVGDMRLFSVVASTADGEVVRSSFELLTVEHTSDEEVRSATGTFVIGDDGDQLVLMGNATYPLDGATIATGEAVRRAVVGGTGRYEGASGWVETIHNADDTWVHRFTLHLP